MAAFRKYRPKLSGSYLFIVRKISLLYLLKNYMVFVFLNLNPIFRIISMDLD
jgi:hypothetical protein